MDKSSVAFEEKQDVKKEHVREERESLIIRPDRTPIFRMQGNGCFGIVLMGMAGLVRAGRVK